MYDDRILSKCTYTESPVISKPRVVFGKCTARNQDERGQLTVDISNMNGNAVLLTFIEKFEHAEAFLLHILRRVSEGGPFDESGFPCIFNAMVCRALPQCGW